MSMHTHALYRRHLLLPMAFFPNYTVTISKVHDFSEYCYLLIYLVVKMLNSGIRFDDAHQDEYLQEVLGEILCAPGEEFMHDTDVRAECRNSEFLHQLFDDYFYLVAVFQEKAQPYLIWFIDAHPALNSVEIERIQYHPDDPTVMVVTLLADLQ